MQKNATPQNNNLTKVGEYNQIVKSYLEEHPITEIIAFTIKNFKSEAYRKRYSDLQYNKAVEDFNKTHGYYLAKKGKEVTQKYYQYYNYPYMDKDAVNATMDNYRAYRDKYNAKAKEYNKEINDFNKEVVQTTDKEINAKIKAFETENKSLFTYDYNKEVESLNSLLGANYIKKKRLQTLYNNLNDIFNVFVGFYVKQLKLRNGNLMECNKSTIVYKNSMPKLKLNYTNTAKHKQNGNLRLETSVKTLQNAVKRLIEAGVIQNYMFFDRKRPVYFNFNPKILVVLDGNPPKQQTTEKLDVNPSKTKKFRNLNHTTRTLLKENKIDDCEKFTDQNKSGSIPKENESNDVRLADSYKNTNQVEDEKKLKLSRAEVQKILPEFLKSTKKRAPYIKNIKAKVEKSMLKQIEFSKMLTDGVFDEYKGLKYDEVQRVIQYSGLFLDELKLFLIQDFIKSSAKIWKNHTVKTGSWYNAITMLNNQLFNGVTDKENLIPKLREYRWKLEYARKWFVHSNVPALYPSLYFDTTRTHKKEIGFYGLHEAWKKNLLKKSSEEAAKKQQLHDANKRKREISNRQKFSNKLNQYFKGDLTINELKNYVSKNLPKAYLLQLNALTNTNPKNNA